MLSGSVRNYLKKFLFGGLLACRQEPIVGVVALVPMEPIGMIGETQTPRDTQGQDGFAGYKSH
jgi:hypothetical protein